MSGDDELPRAPLHAWAHDDGRLHAVPPGVSEAVRGESLPPAPRNVRAVHEDGRTIPLEVVYIGQDHRDGARVWRVTSIIPGGGGWTVLADQMPGRTALLMTVEGDPP